MAIRPTPDRARSAEPFPPRQAALKSIADYEALRSGGPDANTGFVFVSGMNTARVRVLFCSLGVWAGHTV